MSTYQNRLALDYARLLKESIQTRKNILRLLYDNYIPVRPKRSESGKLYNNDVGVLVEYKGNEVIVLWR